MQPDEEERCWRERYRNASRRWLINYEPYVQPAPAPASTMKDEFTAPAGRPAEDARHGGEGVRRQLVRSRILQEAARELAEERARPPPVEDYCTHYTEKFGAACAAAPAAERRALQAQQALQTFPLYASAARTFWTERLDAAARDPLRPFARSAAFSKPLSERLDA